MTVALTPLKVGAQMEEILPYVNLARLTEEFVILPQSTFNDLDRRCLIDYSNVWVQTVNTETERHERLTSVPLLLGLRVKTYEDRTDHQDR